jgi:hypothetical protein
MRVSGQNLKALEIEALAVNYIICQRRWYTPVMLAFVRLRKEDHESKVNLGYGISSEETCAT